MTMDGDRPYALRSFPRKRETESCLRADIGRQNWVPAFAGTTGVTVRAPRNAAAKLYSAAGRSFFTSASDGITLAPSTYLKSLMVPLPFLSAILPT